MNVEITKYTGGIVVAPAGRLDGSTAGELEALLLAQIDSGTCAIILDCSNLSYVSSAGLRVVLIAGKRLRTIDGKLLLTGLNKQIGEVFLISGFGTLFPIFETVAAAQAALNLKPAD